MRGPHVVLPALLAVGILGCGPGDESAQGEAGSAAEDIAESVGELAASGGEADGSMEGSVTFTVNGQEHTFDHVVADETFSMSVSTSASLAPDPAATERFVLIVTRIDLDDYTYPATLPPEGAGTSIETAGQMVAFRFTDAEGGEWAATGDLDVESFEDDVLVATFGELELFDTDSMEPGPTMQGGRIRVEFD